MSKMSLNNIRQLDKKIGIWDSKIAVYRVLPPETKLKIVDRSFFVVY